MRPSMAAAWPVALLLLAVASLRAGEGPSTLVQIQLTSKRVSIGFEPDQVNELAGAVDLRYAGASVLAEQVLYRSTAFGPKAISVLVEGDLTAKPGEHLTIDTTRCELDGIPYRGVLFPRSISIRRQPLVEAKPAQATYQMVFTDVRDFNGLIRMGDGWRQHVGWARTIEVRLVATVTPLGATHLEDPRLAKMMFFGDDQNLVDARNATILRTKNVVEKPDLTTLIRSAEEDAYLEGSTLDIEFDAEGKVHRFTSPLNSQIRGEFPTNPAVTPPKP